MTESGGDTRLEAFSDGVFAVAITLLALNLAIDGPGHGTTLAHQLGEKWPAFAAYVVSFFNIGIVWVNHHGLLRTIRGGGRTLLFLNLILLLFVVAVPFATDTVASYLRTDGPDSHLAAAIYGGVALAMGVSFSVLYVWSLRTGRQTRVLVGRAAHVAAFRFGLGSIGYLLAIGVAFLSAPASLAIDGAVAVYYLFEHFPADT